MVMKQYQWGLALLVLAVMMGLITWAMYHLGSGGLQTTDQPGARAVRELRFYWKQLPLKQHDGIEMEEKSTGAQDYWFVNENDEPVTVGLKNKNCKCTSVELYYLPEEASRELADDAAGLIFGCASPMPPLQAAYLPLVEFQLLALSRVRKLAGAPADLKQGAESVEVPPKRTGWVRLTWRSESEGAQMLWSELWFGSPDSDKTASLTAAVRNYKPLRVRPSLSLGVMREDAIGAGVTGHIICWSSTRTSLNLEAKDGRGHDDPYRDPFVVGKPIPLTSQELRNLEKANAETRDFTWMGRVLCAYRIPVTVLAVSKDGKTPFDLGPFRRNVLLSCPGVTEEPTQVAVTGMVRGIVEVGADSDSAEIKFGEFPRRKGKSESTSIQSEVAGLSLEVDPRRTSSFLKATLSPPDRSSRRQEWRLTVQVLPEKAFGVFPRREDPLLEDSAVYLRATWKVADAKGEERTVSRSVRIAVSGTGNET
jgi:hypothetical protein